MIAKRISGHDQVDSNFICYWKTDSGWLIQFPEWGILGDLRKHTVTEHEDGTISVAPSILVTGHDNGDRIQKHGYLTRGVWTDC